MNKFYWTLLATLLVGFSLSAQDNEFITFGNTNGYGIEYPLGGVRTEEGTLGSVFLEQRAGTNLFDLAIHELDPVNGNVLTTLTYPIGVEYINRSKFYAAPSGGIAVVIDDTRAKETVSFYLSSIRQLEWVNKSAYSEERQPRTLKIAAVADGGLFLLSQTRVGETYADSLIRFNQAGEREYGVQLRQQSDWSSRGEEYLLAPSADGSIALTLPGQQTMLFCKFSPEGGMIWETAFERGAAIPPPISAGTPVGLVAREEGGYYVVAKSDGEAFFWLSYDANGINQSVAYLGANIPNTGYPFSHPLAKISPASFALGSSRVISFAGDDLSVTELSDIPTGISLVFDQNLTRYLFNFERVNSANFDVRVTSFDSGGITNWERTYGKNAFDHSEWFADAFLDTVSGDYFTFGSYDMFQEGKEAVILRQDAYGAIVEIKPAHPTTPGSSKSTPRNMIQLDDGRIAYTYAHGSSLYLVVTDENLNELQRTVFPETSFSDFLGQMNQGNLVIRTVSWNPDGVTTKLSVYSLNQNEIRREREIPGFSFGFAWGGTMLPDRKMVLCGWSNEVNDTIHDIKLITTDLRGSMNSVEKFVPAIPGESYWFDALTLANGDALVLVKPYAIGQNEHPSLPYLLQVGSDGMVGDAMEIFPADFDQTVASAEIHHGTNDTLLLYYSVEQEFGTGNTFELYRMKIMADNLEVVADELVQEGAGRIELKAGQSGNMGQDFVAGCVHYAESDDTDLFLHILQQAEAGPTPPGFAPPGGLVNQPVLYPNPVVDRAQLTFAQAQTEEITVRVFNRSGRSSGPMTFMQAGTDAVTVPLGPIPEGIYTVVGTRPDGSIAFTSRLVKL